MHHRVAHWLDTSTPSDSYTSSVRFVIISQVYNF